MKRRYQCKCCKYFTLKDEPIEPRKHPGTFEICPVCFWEDDSLQYLNPDESYGPNGVSLNNAKENFKKYGAIRRDAVKHVRTPYEYEKGC